MTVYRRLISFAAALALLLTLIPPVTGTITSAGAETKSYGITKVTTGTQVNTRVGAGFDQKLAFKLPANFVCEIRGTKVVNKVTWYKVATIDPARNNSDIHIVYIHGDYIRELTDAEANQYKSSGTVATPTPVPTNNGGKPTPTPTPAPSGKSKDLPAISGSIGSVTAGGTNLREGPGTGYRSITRLDRNTQVELLTIPSIRGAGSNTFFKVRYNNTTGYIMSDFVSILSGGPSDGSSTVVTAAPSGNSSGSSSSSSSNTSAVGYVKTTMGGCNLRATISGTVIKQIGKNVTLPYILEPVKKNGYTWYFVVDGSNRGYLRSDVVKVVKAPAATATPKVTNTPAPEEEATGYLKTTSSGVNLRKKAGYTDVIGQVTKNVVMPYYGEPTKVKGVYWYNVKHPTLGKGWLHSDFVAKCGSDGKALATPTPEPGAEVTPNGNGQEASYTTLKTGSTGTAVKNLVTELQRQGYYSGSITNKYTTTVAAAVKAFQKAKGLSVDGIAGPATQHKLYGTVPIGAGDSSNLTMTLYPAEKIDWYTGGINEMWARGSNYKVYDVKTGIVWWAHRWAGGLHVDAEPLTAADTARLCKCYGVTTAQQIADKNLYQRRPLLVTIGTRTFACSLYGVPHNYPEGDTISTNNFKGQVCIHFTNSKTHDSRKVDSGHVEAIQYAWEHAPNGHK